MIATAAETASQAPWSFIIGAIVGFLVGAKFTIIRRNNGEDK